MTFLTMETNQPTPATPSIADEICLPKLKEQTSPDSLIRYFHDKIVDYIKAPCSDEQLKKLKDLVDLCFQLNGVDKEGRSYDDPYKKDRYNDFVCYLGLPELSTAYLFWTGKSMVKRINIIGCYKYGILTMGAFGKVECYEFSQSMIQYFSDINKPERRRLVRSLESTDKEIEIPCITPTYIHLNCCSFPLNYIKNVDNLSYINFVNGFPISSYYVKQTITPLIKRKLSFAIGYNSIYQENHKEFLAKGFLKIDIESDLGQLKEQTKDGSLVRYFHDKILNYVSTPTSKHSEEELKNLKLLVKLIAGFVNMVTIDDLSKKRIYDDNVKILKIPQLSTSDLFWTGTTMIELKDIVAVTMVRIITKSENGQYSEFPFHIQKLNSLTIWNLLDDHIPDNSLIELPCITPSHLHLKNASLRLDCFANCQKFHSEVVVFFQSPILSYQFNTPESSPVVKQKLEFAINRFKDLSTTQFTDAQKLKLIADGFNAIDKGEIPQPPQPIPDIINDNQTPPAQLCEKSKLAPLTPGTPMISSKEPIWNQTFTCQMFLQRDERNTIFTFEKFYQALITKIESHGFDKTKCHCLLFESTDGKPVLWFTVDGMTQEQLEAFWPRQINVFSEYKFNYEPHISPMMLKKAKFFRHSCVSVKNPASFFIHGDSSANWNALYKALGKAQTLMFASRKNGYFPGRTLYVVSDDIGAQTTEEFLETINPLKEFIIPPNYSTQMIDIIIPTDYNDPELSKLYQ